MNAPRARLFETGITVGESIRGFNFTSPRPFQLLRIQWRLEAVLEVNRREELFRAGGRATVCESCHKDLQSNSLVYCTVLQGVLEPKGFSSCSLNQPQAHREENMAWHPQPL